MNRILGTLALVLLLAAPLLAQPLAIVGDRTSTAFGQLTDSDSTARNYMWFNVILSNTGSGSPVNIGGVSLAAQVGGTWAQQHLSAPANFGPGNVNSDNRFNGLQWAALPGFGANYAFGTSLSGSCDYPTSTSGAFGTIGQGGYLTFGIDNQFSKVTPVSNGMILARLYFGWDGTPLGANTVTVSLIAESGNTANGPSIFTASGANIGSEVFSAPSTFTAGALSITAVTSTTWVYQNTPKTTKDRHQVALTITPTDTWGNNYYTVTITQSGPGVVTPTQVWTYSQTLTPTGTAPVSWTVSAGSDLSGYLVGGRVAEGLVTGSDNAGLVGSCTCTVTVVGDQSGVNNPATAQVTVNVCLLGDIYGTGGVSGLYRNYFTGAMQSPMSAAAARFDPEVFDLDGLGGVSGLDRNYMTQIMAGVTPLQ